MKHKSLWKVSVTTISEAEDAVIELLSAILGFPASAYTDSETGISTVTVYLQRKLDSTRKVREDILAGLKRIKSCGLRIGPGKLVFAKVRREDWAESWKRHFKPIEIGDDLLIKPSWSKRRPRKGQGIIVLDPGLSFGTGHHPTTSFCLHQIAAVARDHRSQRSQSGKVKNVLLAPRGTSGERNVERGRTSKNGSSRRVGSVPANHARRKPPSFLDLGTGSGILAMAAARLGFSPVRAIDFDPEAVRVASANARGNHVGLKLKILRGNVSKLPARPGHRGHRRQGYDLVCANLISDLLIAERRRIGAQLKRTGTLVLAGILKSEFGRVQKAYKTLGLRMVSCNSENEWRSGSFRFSR